MLVSGVGWWSCAVILCSIFVKGRLCYTQGKKESHFRSLIHRATTTTHHHCKHKGKNPNKILAALLLVGFPNKLTLSLSIIAFFPWNCCPSKVRHDTSVCVEKDKRTGRFREPFSETAQTDRKTEGAPPTIKDLKNTGVGSFYRVAALTNRSSRGMRFHHKVSCIAGVQCVFLAPVCDGKGGVEKQSPPFNKQSMSRLSIYLQMLHEHKCRRPFDGYIDLWGICHTAKRVNTPGCRQWKKAWTECADMWDVSGKFTSETFLIELLCSVVTILKKQSANKLHNLPNKAPLGGRQLTATVAYSHIGWQVALCHCQTSYSSDARNWILSCPRDAAVPVGGPPFWLTLQHAEKTETWRTQTHRKDRTGSAVYNYGMFDEQCRFLASIQTRHYHIKIQALCWESTRNLTRP